MKNGCTGKVRYRDHDQAIRAMQTINNNSVRQHTPNHVYACGNCRGFHLSSSMKHSDWVVKQLIAREAGE